jgi:hypothetical protein
MALNNIRFDLSEWLIHFFRTIDTEGKSSPVIPENFGFGNIVDGPVLSSLFMLRSAIRHGNLWATWSYRNGVRTIYGPNPAVCFTEMPIAAFLEAGAARKLRGEAMSIFAIVFPKNLLYNLGANPVIYGLDDRSIQVPSGLKGEKRIFDVSILPLREQYRYVTYNPSAAHPIDWTHEREWRWPFSGDLSEMETELKNTGVVSEIDTIPSLNINHKDLKDLGIIVQTRDEAKLVLHDILSLVDSKAIPRNHYKFILCASELPASDKIRDPKEINQVIAKSMIDLSPYFNLSEKIIQDYNKRFSEIASTIEAAHPTVENGENGGTWLWLLDNTHELTRSLLSSGRITVSKEGHYLVHLREFNNMRGLKQRELMTNELASLISKEFNIESGYFSVLNSTDCNELPFYCDDHLDNRMFYNASE